jgi:hypothetical protein
MRHTHVAHASHSRCPCVTLTFVACASHSQEVPPFFPNRCSHYLCSKCEIRSTLADGRHLFFPLLFSLYQYPSCNTRSMLADRRHDSFFLCYFSSPLLQFCSTFAPITYQYKYAPRSQTRGVPPFSSFVSPPLFQLHSTFVPTHAPRSQTGGISFVTLARILGVQKAAEPAGSTSGTA